MLSCLVVSDFFCDPMDYSLPGSSVHVISQARMLEWVAISFSKVSFRLRDWIHIFLISRIARRILYTEPPGKLCVCVCVCVKTERKRDWLIIRSWLTLLRRLASPKSMRSAVSLETQGRTDVTVCWQNLIFLWGISVFFLRSSSD